MGFLIFFSPILREHEETDAVIYNSEYHPKYFINDALVPEMLTGVPCGGEQAIATQYKRAQVKW